MCDENDGTWLVARIECVICGEKWVAVYCVCPSHLECRTCGYMNPAPLPPLQRWRSRRG